MKMLRLAVLVAVVVMAVPLQAGTKCELTFTIQGWSAFYKTSSGTGTISCDNGQKAKVRLSTKGGGVTFGRSKSRTRLASSRRSMTSASCSGRTATVRRTRAPASPRKPPS